MESWLKNLHSRLNWLAGNQSEPTSLMLNIEQVFHFAQFDIELFKLKQHTSEVGRNDGSGTAWNDADAIAAWLSYLEYALCDVLVAQQDKANASAIERWAKTLSPSDSIISFNYDTLVERALSTTAKAWTHGFETKGNTNLEIPVYKMHGSIDWIVAHRLERLSKLDLIFEKQNVNRRDGNTGHIEDDCCLWRCQNWEQLKNWISRRDLQTVPKGACPQSVGIAGLGSYKPLHAIPGLGRVWTNGLRSVYDADRAIVIGFAMSDFDAMAQLRFAEVARSRHSEKRPLRVFVIDPYSTDDHKTRFKRVFRHVEFVEKRHEDVNWNDVEFGKDVA